MDTVITKDMVRAFVEAANALRQCDDVDIGFALVDLMQEMPIRTQYALYVLAHIYTDHVKARLPEE